MISYIIPAKNEDKYIVGCIRSILNQKIHQEYEILLIDNNCTDGTVGKVKGEFPDVKIVKEEVAGTNPARQRGFLESKGDILIFLDADVRLPGGWTERVIKKISSKENIVAVSSLYLFYDFSWYWKFACYLYIFLIVYPYKFLFLDLLKFGAQMTGGCMVIKRSALEKIGGFDKSYTFYGDDTGTAKALKKFGRVYYSPAYWVYSSARRYTKKGVVKTLLIYVLNYFSIMFKNKPYNTKGEEAVR